MRETMAKSKYILDDKTRKVLCCRVPRLFAEKKIDSATQCISKFNTIKNSPILQSFRIMLAEVIDNQMTVNLLYKESKKILEDYGKQWKVTKFFASKSNKRKFVDINNDLSDSVLDFGVNYQIQQRIFKYKE